MVPQGYRPIPDKHCCQGMVLRLFGRSRHPPPKYPPEGSSRKGSLRHIAPHPWHPLGGNVHGVERCVHRPATPVGGPENTGECAGPECALLLMNSRRVSRGADLRMHGEPSGVPSAGMPSGVRWAQETHGGPSLAGRRIASAGALAKGRTSVASSPFAELCRS